MQAQRGFLFSQTDDKTFAVDSFARVQRRSRVGLLPPAKSRRADYQMSRGDDPALYERGHTSDACDEPAADYVKVSRLPSEQERLRRIDVSALTPCQNHDVVNCWNRSGWDVFEDPSFEPPMVFLWDAEHRMYYGLFYNRYYDATGDPMLEKYEAEAYRFKLLRQYYGEESSDDERPHPSGSGLVARGNTTRNKVGSRLWFSCAPYA